MKLKHTHQILLIAVLLVVAGFSFSAKKNTNLGAKDAAAGAKNTAATANAGNKLVLADFDSGEKPNNLGGDFGAWNKDENDDSQGTKMSFVQDNAKGGSGSAIRLDYDVDSKNPAYNGFWMKLDGLDASAYNTLEFYVKGDAKAGYTNRIKVELKDKSNVSSPQIVSGITDQWQKISLPFDRFRKVKDWKGLNEFVVVFDDVNSKPKSGAILIDDISLVKQ